MPVERKQIEPIFSSMRNMINKCRENNIEGEAFDRMLSVYQKIELYSVEMDNFDDYFARITNEGLIDKFSKHCEEALSVIQN